MPQSLKHSLLESLIKLMVQAVSRPLVPDVLDRPRCSLGRLIVITSAAIHGPRTKTNGTARGV